MKIKYDVTSRGFSLVEIKLSSKNKDTFTIQKSSAVEERVWIGAKELRVDEFIAGRGWAQIQYSDSEKHHVVGNNRLELTRKEAEEVGKLLLLFAMTGDIVPTR